MPKLKELIILFIVALCLTPYTIVFADNGGFSNSVQVLGYGYNSSGEHYTNYTERYRIAYSETYTADYGINASYSYKANQTANSKVKAPESVYHLHLYKGIN